MFANPVRTGKDVSRLAIVPAEEGTPYIAQTIKQILDDLPKSAALIGFAGAPFTLASYAIEGRGSRNYTFVKKMMYAAPQLWDVLMTKLVADARRLRASADRCRASMPCSCSTRGSAVCRSPTIAATLRRTASR